MNTQPDRKDTTTLRQQLYEIVHQAFKHSDVSFGEEDAATDNLLALCQEIAREARRQQKYNTTVALLERFIQLSYGQGSILTHQFKEMLEAVAEEMTGEPMKVELTQQSDKLNKDGGDDRG